MELKEIQDLFIGYLPIGIFIFVVILFGLLYGTFRYKCPKCRKRENIEELESNLLGIVSPRNVRKVLRCKDCGYVWTVIERDGYDTSD